MQGSAKTTSSQFSQGISTVLSAYICFEEHLLVTVSAFRMALLATNTTPTTSWDVSSALKTRKRICLSLNVSITGNLCASSSVRLYSWPSCTNMKLKTDPLLLSCLESHAYSDSWTEAWTWQKPYPIGASNTQSAEHCKLLSSFHKKRATAFNVRCLVHLLLLLWSPKAPKKCHDSIDDFGSWFCPPNRSWKEAWITRGIQLYGT